jgi:hypothetical protein
VIDHPVFASVYTPATTTARFAESERFNSRDAATERQGRIEDSRDREPSRGIDISPRMCGTRPRGQASVHIWSTWSFYQERNGGQVCFPRGCRPSMGTTICSLQWRGSWLRTGESVNRPILSGAYSKIGMGATVPSRKLRRVQRHPAQKQFLKRPAGRRRSFVCSNGRERFLGTVPGLPVFHPERNHWPTDRTLATQLFGQIASPQPLFT